MERRQMIGAGLAAGLAGLAAVDTAEAAAQGESRVREAIGQLSYTLDRRLDLLQPGPLGAVAPVREQQRIFMRANHKYPDFIEVGLDVWESLYFWHIAHQQPVTTGRLADGRFTIAFMFTTVILRSDTPPDYVGLGFDGSPTR
jgi:hypothetical protein